MTKMAANLVAQQCAMDNGIIAHLFKISTFAVENK